MLYILEKSCNFILVNQRIKHHFLHGIKYFFKKSSQKERLFTK